MPRYNRHRRRLPPPTLDRFDTSETDAYKTHFGKAERLINQGDVDIARDYLKIFRKIPGTMAGHNGCWINIRRTEMDTALTLALEVIGGPMDGLRTCIRDNKSPTLIGRQVGNHLTLPLDMTVSRWHTNVSKQGKEFYLTDDKSLAGTWHNGSRISKIKLDPGMMLKVGGPL